MRSPREVRHTTRTISTETCVGKMRPVRKAKPAPLVLPLEVQTASAAELAQSAAPQIRIQQREATLSPKPQLPPASDSAQNHLNLELHGPLTSKGALRQST